jgi:hypothetical protein
VIAVPADKCRGQAERAQQFPGGLRRIFGIADHTLKIAFDFIERDAAARLQDAGQYGVRPFGQPGHLGKKLIRHIDGKLRHGITLP